MSSGLGECRIEMSTVDREAFGDNQNDHSGAKCRLRDTMVMIFSQGRVRRAWLVLF